MFYSIIGCSAVVLIGISVLVLTIFINKKKKKAALVNDEVNIEETSTVKEEVTDVVKVAYETLKIMYDIYPDLLKERYGVDMEIQAEEDEGYFQDPFYDIFLAMAKKRGCILSGGRIDEERFARLFLNDLREGRTGRITLEMPEDFK